MSKSGYCVFWLLYFPVRAFSRYAIFRVCQKTGLLHFPLCHLQSPPKIHIGMEIEGQESPSAGGRLIWPQRTRMTRKLKKGLLPPQKSFGTLLAAMATVWNGLPEAIKSEKSETKYKKKIAAFCINLQQSQV
jgi:hypothetical protein